MTFRRVGARELARHWRVRFSVIEIEDDKGQRFERALIQVPRAVAVVPMDGDEVVLVRQYRAPLESMLLEIPAGIMDVEGESPVDAAGRELIEEIGMAAGTLERLVGFHNMAGCSDHMTTIFLATDLEARAIDRHGPEEEGMTIERVPLAEVPARIERGEITDAKTIIGLLLARGRLAAGSERAERGDT